MGQYYNKFNIHVAGTTFEGRQYLLRAIRQAQKLNKKVTPMLRREPNNERNPNAIAILIQTDDGVHKIGYVPAKTALWLSKKMDNGLYVRADYPKVLGGSPRCPTLGMELQISHETRT